MMMMPLHNLIVHASCPGLQADSERAIYWINAPAIKADGRYEDSRARFPGLNKYML